MSYNFFHKGFNTIFFVTISERLGTVFLPVKTDMQGNIDVSGMSHVNILTLLVHMFILFVICYRK